MKAGDWLSPHHLRGLDMVTHTSCLSSLCLNLWSFILHINELGHGKEVKTQDNSYEDLWSSLLHTPPPHPHPLPANLSCNFQPLCLPRHPFLLPPPEKALRLAWYSRPCDWNQKMPWGRKPGGPTGASFVFLVQGSRSSATYFPTSENSCFRYFVYAGVDVNV